MKRFTKADRVLAAVFILFLLFLAVHKYFPGNFVARLSLAAAEAALIGGIADWFAVTALFKKPLGFPWHTALIPRHRGKLTAGIADMIQGNLLSSSSVCAQLASITLVDYAISFLEKDERTVSSRIIPLGEKVILKCSGEKMVRNLADIFKHFAASLDVKPILEELAGIIEESQEVDKGLDKLLDKLIILAERTVFLAYLTNLIKEISEVKAKQPESLWDLLKGAAKQFFLGAAQAADIFNPRDAALSIQEELLNLLKAAKQSHSPLRKVLLRGIGDIIRQLKDKEVQIGIADWQCKVIAELDLTTVLTIILQDLKTALSAKNDNLVLIEWLTVRIEKYWHIFRYSKAMQDWLEKYLQRGAVRLVSAQEELIGQIVVEALTSLSDEELNEFVAEKTGHDLAWIRINGSVVGGIVGTVLFLFVEKVYTPLIVPIIRSIFL